MSSRVIVKNLPKKTKESQFRDMFSECGEVTDCKLMVSEKGTFRRFGFIGFASERQAETAVKRFHNTFIKATKIQVELAKPYGDESIARPWSKYSKGSSAYTRLQPQSEEGSGQKKAGAKAAKKQGEDRVNENVHGSRLVKLLKEAYEMEGDSDFQEFLAAHKSKSTVRMWSNDDNLERGSAVVGGGPAHLTEEVKVRAKVESVPSRKPGGEGVYYTRTHIKFGDDDDAADDDAADDDDAAGTNNETEAGRKGGDDSKVTPPSRQPISDMEYLQSKMVGRRGSASELEEMDTMSHASEGSCSDGDLSGLDDGEPSEEHDSKQSKDHAKSHTVKMLGLPFSVRPNDIHEFFHPLEVLDIRWTKDKKGRPSGRAYVDFGSEKDLVEALRHDGDYIKERYIELFRDKGPSSEIKTEKDPKLEPKLKPWEVKLLQQEGNKKEEDVSDSGRLFVRNLAYTCTEEDLTSLFGRFGPLTEVSLPLDTESNKVIGYAFVTFMFPEHAVKAYQDCDGTIYQGRLLHILPAKPRDTGEGNGGDAEAESFKKRKEKQLKSQASSSHTWNTLFLGQNAVADSMADRYGTQKGHILNSEGSQSVAVRMALGETQVVSEVKEFLEDQGVNLDVFGKPDTARSKTVILVKNLPFGTTDKDLMVLFSPFGSFVRVVLPPGGTSALVEFTEASHAKAAFTKLAYSKFKHLPLYLEWAPVGALGSRRRSKSRDTPGERKEDGEHQKDENMEVEAEHASDNATLFVKNLNFATSEDTLREHFAAVGPVQSVSIARKRNAKDPSKPLSMGFGFVGFESTALAQDCIKRMQGSELEGHKLELKLSHKDSVPTTQEGSRKTAKLSKQTGAKILVRNLPFEATKREVEELFKTFGEIKMIRLPKKTGGSRGAHRGFAFVEFVTKEDARRAFDALCLSTHLYGRRLVLEWAEDDDSVEALRKRTSEHFHGDKPPARRSRQIAKELLFSLDSSHSKTSTDE